MNKKQSILWVDDDPVQVLTKTQYLEDSGYEVDVAVSPLECVERVKQKAYDLVVLDVMMPHGAEFDVSRTKAGLETGVELARLLKRDFPDLRIVGCSVGDDRNVSEWFQTYGTGYWLKGDLRPSPGLVRKVKSALGEALPPKTFIIHGHNDATTFQLKNYLQNVLGLGEPIILREQPSSGRTIIEKFEDESEDVELVFALLTPDDCIFAPGSPTDGIRRSRQNVIFELGYFYGRVGRRSGRVIVLHQGPLDIPSDIAGIIYISIDKGIEAAGEEIRREVRIYLR